MKPKNTVSLQAYGSQELYDFLKQDMHANGYRSLSQEINHALEQYAKTKGWSPQTIADQQAIQHIASNPELLKQLLQQVLNGVKTLFAC